MRQRLIFSPTMPETPLHDFFTIGSCASSQIAHSLLPCLKGRMQKLLLADTVTWKLEWSPFFNHFPKSSTGISIAA